MQNVPCRGYNFVEAQSICYFIDGRARLDLYNPVVNADMEMIDVMVPPRVLARGKELFRSKIMLVTVAAMECD